jgi:hypothetical protein
MVGPGYGQPMTGVSHGLLTDGPLPGHPMAGRAYGRTSHGCAIPLPLQAMDGPVHGRASKWSSQPTAAPRSVPGQSMASPENASPSLWPSQHRVARLTHAKLRQPRPGRKKPGERRLGQPRPTRLGSAQPGPYRCIEASTPVPFHGYIDILIRLL